MKRMFVSLVLAALAGAALFPACGGYSGLEDCPAGKAFYSPAGCPEGLGEPLEEAGCYASCTEEGAACEGGTCRTVAINPCPCDPGEACCDACGGALLLCVP